MRDRRVAWGASFLLLLGLTALAAPWLGLRDPSAQPDGLVLRDLPPLTVVDAIRLRTGDLSYAHEVRLSEDGAVEYRRGERWRRLEPGALAADWHARERFVLGTDGYGRDLLSRLAHGARVSLLIGLLAAAIALVVGAGLGLLAGLAGGWVDDLVMRVVDLTLSVPRLFLALMLVAFYGPSMTTTVVVLAATTWMAAARLTRGEILSLREREHVRAARALGAPPWRIGWRHVLPAALTPVLVETTLRVGDTILLEATLSFLGLGVPAPTASWGNLIADGRDGLLDTWWIATVPGLAIAATVIALNLLGDGLSERLGGRGRARKGSSVPSRKLRWSLDSARADVALAGTGTAHGGVTARGGL